MSFQVQRYHDISCGHRVVGHETKCRHLHGHNYRIHFICEASPWRRLLRPEEKPLDSIGRVIDFSEVKSRLCMWVENNWDHKFLHWQDDPLFKALAQVNSVDWDFGFGFPHPIDAELDDILTGSLVAVPFNPTAENMAEHLVKVVGPQQLEGTGIVLVRCIVEETMKCSASFNL